MRRNFIATHDKSYAGPGVGWLNDEAGRRIQMHAPAIEAHDGSQRSLRVLATAPTNDAPLPAFRNL